MNRVVRIRMITTFVIFSVRDFEMWLSIGMLGVASLGMERSHTVM